MKRLLTSLLALLGLVFSLLADDIPLKEGECCTYATRPGEEESFLVIRKIEVLPKLGEVVHISIYGLKIKNPSAPAGLTNQAGPVPISGTALRASLKEKLPKEVPDGDWTEGYQLWREAFDSGKGGVFTISVGDCVGVMEEAIRKAKEN